MNIVNHFHAAAKQFPNQVAIVYKGNATSYAALQQLVFDKAFGLQKAGINAGDNLMLMIPYSLELYIHILAVFHIGARVILVDAIKDKKGVVAAFEKAECKGILTIPVLRILKYFLFDRKLWGKFFTVPRGKGKTCEAVEQNEQDSALITFTSGTTGNPKAADRTHGFLNIQLSTLIEEMCVKPNDVHITSLPVVLMCNLAVGATSIIPPKPNKSAEWNFIKTHHSPNMVSASPAHFSNFINRLDVKIFNKVFIGGATILPHFVEEITKQINPVSIHFAYGSTEAEPIALISAVEALLQNPNEKGICVGEPHPAIKLQIASVQDGQIAEMDEGDIGEVLVAGQHVLNNYYKDEAAFKANKVVEGETVWHRTGDLGYVRKGKLYFYGRLKHAWFEGEELVSPLVYEKFLSQNCSNAEGTCLHLNDRNVVFVTGVKLDEIAMLNQQFAYPIHDVILLPKLPKDKRHLSRIDYEKLIGKYFG